MKQIVVALATLSLAAAGHAQDTRTVTEPTIPASCTVLKAKLAASGGIDPADEVKLDGTRLQKALDGCAAGQAVELAADGAHNAFLTGPLEMRKGVTLLVDGGVTLYGSRNPKDYQVPGAAGTCGVVDKEKPACKPLIGGKDAAGSAIMGDGTIDGRGGSKLLIDGKESAKTWWDLAEDARKEGHQQNPRLIVMDSSDNFTLYRITLKNAAFFHVTYSHGNGFTVWGLRIDTPANARNTDGVDPGDAKNITVTQSFIRDGDDNIAIKGGSGPVTNMTVIHNHFYWGHGMSIGSETNAGVSSLRVTDLSLDGTTSGIRIKSNVTRGGLVHDVVYDDVCIRGSKTPIDLDTSYTYPGKEQNSPPTFAGITLRNVRISGGGTVKLNGFDSTHRIGIRFDGVMEDAPSSYKFVAHFADITLGPGPVNLKMAGESSTVSGTPGKGTLASCADKFVPFPAAAK